MANETIKQFWLQKKWPDDGFGYTFLLKAVGVIGKAMHRDEWTGMEPIEPFKPIGLVRSFQGILVNTSQDRASLRQRRQIFDLLEDHGEEYSRPFSINGIPFSFSDDQWETGLALSWKQDERTGAAFDRFVSVMKLIKDAAMSGILKTAMREIPGGDLETLSPMKWNTEHYSWRFACGLIDRSNPFGEIPYGPELFASPSERVAIARRTRQSGDWRYLFVNGRDLSSLADSFTSSAAKQTEAVGVSRRGAKPQYDWPRFDGELARLIEHEGSPDPSADPNWTQAKIEERMAIWCHKEWGKEPSEATIRKKVSKYLKTLEGLES